MTDREKLELLIKTIEESVPYVQATINEGNSFQSKDRPDWIEVHEGRIISSRNQLRNLMSKVKECKGVKDK